MALSKTLGRILVALTILGPVGAAAAHAVPLVTYTWTTTSEGYGLALGEPSTATFQVPLSDVQNGFISQFDVTNIQLAYPGLTFNGTTTSGIGFDFGAYVDPLTGAFIYHDDQQGFAVFAGAPDIYNWDTMLSILVDNPVSGAVKDQFNALDHYNPAAGYPTAGYWTASFPTVVAATPLPAALPLFASGLGGIGFLGWRRKRAKAGA